LTNDSDLDRTKRHGLEQLLYISHTARNFSIQTPYNHQLYSSPAARTLSRLTAAMADDPSKENSPRTEPAEIEANEDAETRATRRELKQSTLSDAAPSTAAAGSDTEQDKAADPTTPPQDASDSRDQDQLKDDVLSPKKKRAHDQLDKDQTVDDNDATSIASTDSAKDRASRLEPEKKRHRDGEVAGEQSVSLESANMRASATSVSQDATLQEAAAESAQSTADKAAPASATTQPQTSTSAFSASGFGKLAAGASPFASLSGAKSTGFGSAKSPPPTQPAAPPKLTFGGGSSASPFAGLGSNTSNGFGSAFGGGSSSFGSAFGVAKPLSSFAAPGSKPLKSEKPAKPFGAPDSDAEDADDDEGDEEEDAGEERSQPDEERLPSPEKEPEEKRKLKLQRGEFGNHWQRLLV
jgi:DEAD/DEAH box helicase domain-containing protein